jgi:hypothetical protein
LEERVRTVDRDRERGGHRGWVGVGHSLKVTQSGSLAGVQLAGRAGVALGGTVRGRQGWMTMEGLRRIALIALIIAVALYLFVFLGFAAYSIFLIAKWLVGYL